MADSAVARIATGIHKLLERPNPVLFAGAGVGCRVGFPSWDQYIEHFAAVCDQFGDSESALLVRKRLEQRNHLGAATVFKTSAVVPEGERWKAIAEPFHAAIADGVLERLLPLAKLPFTAIVTTNYEHSLHDACSRVRTRWVQPIERDTLRGASLAREFFVARIHGNAEQPTTMIVDAVDYRLLREDAIYLDFILHLLTTRSCLFLGFSFLDPAISHVLSIYAERFGPTYPALHTALVPSGDPALNHRLRQLNIETIAYDTDDRHAAFWRGILEASESTTRTLAREDVTLSETTIDVTVGHGAIHRFVAFTYAQSRVRNDTQPVVAVAQDGIVASVLSSQPSGTMAESDLAAEVATILRLTAEESAQVVASSLDRLAARDHVLRDESIVAWVAPGESDLDKQLTRLAGDALDRSCVREGIQPKDKDKLAAKVLIERVLMSRAWDIAAHLAGGNSGWTADVRGLVRKGIAAMPSNERPTSPETLERAIHDLFRAPDSQEAVALTSLGRAAFGLQLLLASPRQTLFHQHALPEILYFDASVLMPAITTGHPLRPAYMDIVARLREAGDNAGVHLVLAVGVQFLNEIVSHRRLAIEMVTAANLEDPDNLRRHIQFHSAENTNVFVGAYGSLVGRAAKKIAFAEFLAQAAPFGTEDGLATHLERLGIRTVEMEFKREHNLEYVSIFNPLKQVFEDSERHSDKAAILVKHEAQQLTQLLIDAKRGDRSLFVTADRHLRRALTAHPQLRRLSGMTLSHLGLVALADVMIGVNADARSLARLVWAAPAGESEKSLFDYFVTLGLREYHEGLATELQSLATRSVKEASETAKGERVSFFGSDPDDVARRAAFLDRFEDRFYQNWRDAIRRRERS
jgi:hypothetical protein